MTDYHPVFTVLQKSAPWQPFVIVAVIVAIGTVVAVVNVVRRRARLFMVLITYAIFLLVAVTVYPSGIGDMYARAKKSYISGQYSVVEGTVTNFHPMPYSGHQNETFSVNGVQFSYSDYVIVPCFNNTSSHGGPIREGLRVRIAYSDDCILKLDVAGFR
jgi:hypothetical protein